MIRDEVSTFHYSDYQTQMKSARVHPNLHAKKMTTIAAVKNRLQSTAGVSPSRQWLEECLVALQISSSTDLEAAAASVLEQLLSHDLRQVVRTTTTTTTTTTAQGSDDDGSSTTMQLMLRQAIRQSQIGENRKAVLPESFRLLVQLEECLDVSSTAEVRMAAVVSGSAGGNGASFSGSRCLKVCYADGFFSDGKRQFGTPISGNQVADNNSIPCSLIAMEVSPIPDLSVQSPAGLKIVLAGPITIRHGMAGWHSGNAIVLGGQVADMVAIQRQALHSAQQRMGHGIDPTVKALIWNTTGHDDSQVLDGENDGACVTFQRVVARFILTSHIAAVRHPQTKRNGRVAMYQQRQLCSPRLRLQSSSSHG
jgi:RecQ mediated genome instability protein